MKKIKQPPVWIQTPVMVEAQQYPDGTHICVANKNGDWIADCGREDSEEAHERATLIVKAINNNELLTIHLAKCVGAMALSLPLLHGTTESKRLIKTIHAEAMDVLSKILDIK